MVDFLRYAFCFNGDLRYWLTNYYNCIGVYYIKIFEIDKKSVNLKLTDSIKK